MLYMPRRVGYDTRAMLHDTQVARAINGDRIDVLLDVDYFKNRMEVLALHPAPTQINFLAHPGTSGAHFCEYARRGTTLPRAHRQRSGRRARSRRCAAGDTGT